MSKPSKRKLSLLLTLLLLFNLLTVSGPVVGKETAVQASTLDTSVEERVDGEVEPSLNWLYIVSHAKNTCDKDSYELLSVPDLDNAPPLLPAAFYGNVVDQAGNPVAEGTIQAVVDGVIRGEISFTGGEFGISAGMRLLVYSNRRLGSNLINFYVN